jgi:hypothetical protein
MVVYGDESCEFLQSQGPEYARDPCEEGFSPFRSTLRWVQILSYVSLSVEGSELSNSSRARGNESMALSHFDEELNKVVHLICSLLDA